MGRRGIEGASVCRASGANVINHRVRVVRHWTVLEMGFLFKDGPKSTLWGLLCAESSVDAIVMSYETSVIRDKPTEQERQPFLSFKTNYVEINEMCIIRERSLPRDCPVYQISRAKSLDPQYQPS